VRRRGGISSADAEALREFGIDIDRIIARIKQDHGPNALAGAPARPGRRWPIPFAEDSKKTLQLCLKEPSANPPPTCSPGSGWTRPGCAKPCPDQPFSARGRQANSGRKVWASGPIAKA
jgi:hypothetical protein